MKTQTDPNISEEDRVIRWRLSCFLSLGYDADEAIELAESNIDLRELEGLLKRGCKREVATRILL
jgi:hypothetical protein